MESAGILDWYTEQYGIENRPSFGLFDETLEQFIVKANVELTARVDATATHHEQNPMNITFSNWETGSNNPRKYGPVSLDGYIFGNVEAIVDEENPPQWTLPTGLTPADGSVKGEFYGPNREEVGGIFEFNFNGPPRPDDLDERYEWVWGIHGVFGAKKTE